MLPFPRLTIGCIKMILKISQYSVILPMASAAQGQVLRILCIAGQIPLFIATVMICCSLFTYLPVQASCFQFGAMANTAAMNIHDILVRIYVSFS